MIEDDFLLLEDSSGLIELETGLGSILLERQASDVDGVEAPTGIAAVIDMRPRQRAERAAEEKRRRVEAERRQAVEDAFEQVFGEPKPRVVTEEQRRAVDRAVLQALREGNLRTRLADAAIAVDRYMEHLQRVERMRKDEESIIMLMMAA